MEGDLLTLAFTALDAFVALASVIASIYIVYVYGQVPDGKDKAEAVFLARLVHRDVRVSAAAALILGYIALSLSGTKLGTPWGAVLISIAVVAMMIGPIGDAYLWWKERRSK